MISPTENAKCGLFASGFVLSAEGEELFRYQKNFFAETDDGDKSFIDPIPKLAVVTSGAADWLIGSNTYHVRKGDIVVLRPGVLHHFLRIPSNTMVECDIYEFVPSFISDCECMGLFVLESGQENTLLKYDPKRSPRILECFDEIKKELALTEPCCTDAVRSLLTYCIVSLIRFMGLRIGTNRAVPRSHPESSPHALPLEHPAEDTDRESASVSTDHSTAVAEVIGIINRSISTDISISELASSAHMSRSHFYKIFRKYTGMSINDFILKCRVENTVRLLLNTGCSVIEAAYESGFTSRSGFYKAFKKITGLSPKEYLKSIRMGRTSLPKQNAEGGGIQKVIKSDKDASSAADNE